MEIHIHSPTFMNFPSILISTLLVHSPFFFYLKKNSSLLFTCVTGLWNKVGQHAHRQLLLMQSSSV